MKNTSASPSPISAPVKIGIFSCLSAEATAFYRNLFEKTLKIHFGNRTVADVITFSIVNARMNDFESVDSKEKLASELTSGFASLEYAGAKSIITVSGSASTLYKVKRSITLPSSTPDMITILKNYLEEIEFSKALFLDRINEDSKLYHGIFKNGKNKTIIFPTPKDQYMINEVIHHELLWGEIKEDTKKELLESLKKYEADLVVIASPALSLLIGQRDFKVTVIDNIDMYMTAIMSNKLINFKH